MYVHQSLWSVHLQLWIRIVASAKLSNTDKMQQTGCRAFSCVNKWNAFHSNLEKCKKWKIYEDVEKNFFIQEHEGITKKKKETSKLRFSLKIKNYLCYPYQERTFRSRNTQQVHTDKVQNLFYKRLHIRQPFPVYVFYTRRHNQLKNKAHEVTFFTRQHIRMCLPSSTQV